MLNDYFKGTCRRCNEITEVKNRRCDEVELIELCDGCYEEAVEY